jgi:hypothetical protein
VSDESVARFYQLDGYRVFGFVGCSSCLGFLVSDFDASNRHDYLDRVFCVVCCSPVQSESAMSESIRYESAERVRDFYREQGRKQERERIIALLLELNVVRRCAATDKLVAFDTNGENVLYLTGLELK